jgi:hypothetical protein
VKPHRCRLRAAPPSPSSSFFPRSQKRKRTTKNRRHAVLFDRLPLVEALARTGAMSLAGTTCLNPVEFVRLNVDSHLTLDSCFPPGCSILAGVNRPEDNRAPATGPGRRGRADLRRLRCSAPPGGGVHLRGAIAVVHDLFLLMPYGYGSNQTAGAAYHGTAETGIEHGPLSNP